MMVNATHVYEYRSLKLYGHEGRQNMQTCNTAVRWDKIPSAFAHDYVNAWNGFAMMVNATHVYEYRYLKLYGHEGRKEGRKEGKKAFLASYISLYLRTQAMVTNREANREPDRQYCFQ
jgi:hypothetical protein